MNKTRLHCIECIALNYPCTSRKETIPRVKTRVSIPESSERCLSLFLIAFYRLQVAALSASRVLERRSHPLRLTSTAAWNRKLRVGNRIGGPPENGEDTARKVHPEHPMCEENENCFPAYLALISRTSIDERRQHEASFDETKKFNENGNRISRKHFVPQFALNFHLRENY